MAEEKEWSRRGVKVAEKELGWKRGWFVRKLKCSFEILSEKYVANSCGRAARGDDVGS